MTKPLFDSFNAVSAKEWKQKIQFDLKGADYNEALIHKSFEGIDIKPFYHREDLPKNEISVQHPTHWKNMQQIEVDELQKANKTAIQAIANGAESIFFVIKNEQINPIELIKNITTDIYIDTIFLSPDYYQKLETIASKSKNKIYIVLDIIGHLTKTGNWHNSLKKDFDTLTLILREHKHLKKIISIDVDRYQNAGATMIQQLAYGLAHANEYLNYLSEKNIALENTSIIFKTAVGGNYFFEIAKLRALRILWNTLASEYEMLKKCYIFAQPSRRNKSILDYNVNMLRTTTECMSAILGGADLIANIRYDDIYNYDNDFGNRIAINQLLILKNESYFDIVSNPASGSYYIENLTNQLAEKALIVFKNIEKGGGFLTQLKSGKIQKKIKENADKEQQLFDQEKIIVIGVNKYRNKNEIDITPQKDLSTHKKIRKTLINPIITRRLCDHLEIK